MYPTFLVWYFVLLHLPVYDATMDGIFASAGVCEDRLLEFQARVHAHRSYILQITFCPIGRQYKNEKMRHLLNFAALFSKKLKNGDNDE